MDPALRIHVLKRDSPDLDAALLAVLSLSNEIFSPDPNTKYSSLSFWKERLSHESSLIVYLTTPRPDGGTTRMDDRPIAFLFVHPRTHDPPLQDGSINTPHIWLAGVLPEWRKIGCLQRMMREVVTEPDCTYTICTIPSVFPNMWPWLLKRGWKQERELGEGRIMLSIRSGGPSQ